MKPKPFGPHQRIVRHGKGLGSFLYDPNRIFTDAGILATINHYNRFFPGKKKSLKLIKNAFQILKRKVRPELLKRIPLNPQTYVIALHNTRSYTPYSALKYLDRPEYEVYLNPAHPVKNFVIVTRQKEFEILKTEGINSVWQKTVNLEKNDGSLSAYAGIQGMPMCVLKPFKDSKNKKNPETVLKNCAEKDRIKKSRSQTGSLKL